MEKLEWPWPGDSREDRARRVAISYREFIYLVFTGVITADPLSSLRDLDDRWMGLGQTWIKPSESPLRLDDWLTAESMGDLLSIPAKWVYNWGMRGQIRVSRLDGRNVYNVGDVVEYERSRRVKRKG
jgi:hypothetical protein